MIKKLKLTNWRSHEKSELSFSKGTNIIIGIMGAGKSSVVDAICFALFGRFPALQERRRGIEDMIMSRPERKNDAAVELEFEVDGSEFIVERKIVRGKSASAMLRKNGKPIGGGSERVSEYIEEALRIDYELFTRAIFSEQNRIDYFLTLRAGERKQKIDELLGIDRFELARANLRSVINKFEQQAEQYRQLLGSKDIEGLGKALDETEKKLAEIAKKMKAHEAEGEKAEAELKKANAEHGHFERRRKEWEGLSNEEKAHEKTIELLEEDLKKAKIIADHRKAKEEMERAEQEKKNVDEKLREVERKARNASAGMGALESRANDIESKIKANEKYEKEMSAILDGSDLGKLEKKLDDERKLVEKARAAFEEMRKAQSALEHAGAKCPVCEQPIGEEKKHELHRQRGEELKELEKQIEKEKEVGALEKSFRRAREIEKMIARVEKGELEKIKNEIKTARGQLEGLEKEQNVLEKQRNELEKTARELGELVRIAVEAEQKREKLLKYERELKEVRARLAELKFDEKEAKEIERRMREAEALARELKAKLEGLAGHRELLDAQAAEQRKALQEAEKLAKSAEGMEAKREELEVLHNALVDVQNDLRGRLIEAVNVALKEIWPAVYPYTDYPELRLRISENGYELEMGDGQDFIAADGIASGGERACASLALRIAFARILAPNLSWLMLDEPTHNLDAEAIRSLSHALREEIPAVVDQIFVITHEEALRDAASGRLYIIERDKARNEPSRAEMLV